MGSHHRPRNEYNIRNDERDESNSSRRRKPQRMDFDELSPAWSEIRVVRQVDTQMDETSQWHAFQDNLGELNYGKGKAHAPGSMAVVYVPAKEMGRMLNKKYPEAYQSPQKARQLQRKVAGGIQAFVRDSFDRAYDEQTVALEQDTFRGRAAVGEATVAFAFADSVYEDEWETQGSATAVLPTDEDAELFLRRDCKPYTVPTSQPYFGEKTVVKVDGLDIFGKDGFAADLRFNEQLHEERSAVLNYLRTDEKLDTSMTNPGWAPHATVFTFEQHISVSSLTHELSIPDEIGLQEPKPIIL